MFDDLIIAVVNEEAMASTSAKPVFQALAPHEAGYYSALLSRLQQPAPLQLVAGSAEAHAEAAVGPVDDATGLGGGGGVEVGIAAAAAAEAGVDAGMPGAGSPGQGGAASHLRAGPGAMVIGSPALPPGPGPSPVVPSPSPVVPRSSPVIQGPMTGPVRTKQSERSDIHEASAGGGATPGPAAVADGAAGRPAAAAGHGHGPGAPGSGRAPDVNEAVVRVARVEGKGKCLVAGRAFKPGEVLFMEAPLAAMQHVRNAAVVRACDHCCRFIGTLQDQLSRVITVRMDAEAKAKLAAEDAEAVNDENARRFPPLPKGFQLPALADADAAVLSPVVPCATGCDAEYCSPACRDAAARQYHTLLCPRESDEESEAGAEGDGSDGGEERDADACDGSGSGSDHNEPGTTAGPAGGAGARRAGHSHHRGHHHDGSCSHGHGHSHGGCHHQHGDDHDGDEDETENSGGEEEEEEEEEDEDTVNAAALFRRQALMTSELFLLCGRLYGRILEAWARNGNDMAAAMRPFLVLHGEPWWKLFAVREGYLSPTDPSSGASGVRQKGKHAREIAALRAQLGEWLLDSVTILKQLVRARLPAVVAVVQARPAAGPSSLRRAGAVTGDAAATRSSRTQLTELEESMLFDVDVYERLVGAFELNNITLEIDSPLRDYLNMITCVPYHFWFPRLSSCVFLLLCWIVVRSAYARSTILARVLDSTHGDHPCVAGTWPATQRWAARR